MNSPCELLDCARTARICRAHYDKERDLAQAHTDARCQAKREDQGQEHVHYDSCSYTKGRFDAEDYSVKAEDRSSHAVHRAVAGVQRAFLSLSRAQRAQVLAGLCHKCLRDYDDPECTCTHVAPIQMVLHCPECKTRHVDVGEFATKPHHTHACQGCGFVWRPAIASTVGMQFLPGFKNEEGITDEVPHL